MARILLDRPFNPATDVRSDEDHVGEPWPYALIDADQEGNETTVLADSCTDILGYLIEGYDDIPNTPEGVGEAFAQREARAFHIASLIQSLMVNDAVVEGKLDLDAAPVEITDALLTDRSLPTIGIDEWTHPVPLVLVSTLYQPFGTTVPPGGNIVWVEPHDERGFLDNLVNLGVVKFYVHETA